MSNFSTPKSPPTNIHQPHPELGSNNYVPQPPTQESNFTTEISTISTQVTRDIKKVINNTLPDALRSLLGQPTSIDLDPQKIHERDSDALYWQKRFQASERERQEEKLVIQERHKQQEFRIVQIREQIEHFNDGITQFNREIDITTFNAATSNTTDTYTENFFTQLISFLLQIQKRINKAVHWLALHNKRSNQKGPFFMQGHHMQVDSYQSQERRVSFTG